MESNDPRPPRSHPPLVVLCLLFFLSGLAALIYQIVWARSLSLVFGGSHLAVTTVLAVFMGGLALGGSLLGARADRARRPLRLYAALELGIALSAAAFHLLLQVYPLIYAPLAGMAETNRLWLTAVRVALACLGMLVPTTLMGGTLPVLSRCVAGRAGEALGHVGLLYALNTLGAVAGTLAAGFLLLPRLGVTRSVCIAVAINVLIGAVARLLPERASGPAPTGDAPSQAPLPEGGWPSPFRLALIGIGVSGFCALGYEVLWTRVLTLVVGTSVYSFTILLAAFLTGIAAGGQSESIVRWCFGRRAADWRCWLAVFAASQILIGLLALAVTRALRDLPRYALGLQETFRPGAGEFGAQQVATIAVAFAFLVGPAFFMGLAFPAAGNVLTARHRQVGRAVGEVLAFNTVGAILGAAVSGFVLLYLFGFERSLHFLILANLWIGCAALASLVRPRARAAVVAAVAAAALSAGAALALSPQWGRVWDRKFFAIFRNNQYQAFNREDRIRDALANTDVLYFFEGANETISVILPRGAQQGLIVNGRVEASTALQDRQCQRTLGHLPMLAHPDPRKVFVLGAGTGMTLGATTLHPEAREIVLAEIEPGVLPAARTFAEWNHRALDNPKVRVVVNDGRNYLRTTRERFDVITADPIHPWSGGASYLYTDEYFRLASSRLKPGGVICQWLPIYELDAEDLRAVVRTFTNNLRYAMLWLTHYDAELLGSNEPIALDPIALDRRISYPPIREDLREVFMGSSEDLLAYFVSGTEGLREFSRDGVLNTDDNLWLEFHSPKSRMMERLPGDNVVALTRHRQSLRGGDLEAARLYDRAHATFLWGRSRSAEFAETFDALVRRFPGYAPGRFLAREVEERNARRPVMRGQALVEVRRAAGAPAGVVLSVVTLRIGPERGVVMIVDNEAREVYAERYVDAPREELDAVLDARARSVLAGIREARPGTAQEWRERIDRWLREAEEGNAP